MKIVLPTIPPRIAKWFALAAVVAGVALLTALFPETWMPNAHELLESAEQAAMATESHAGADGHDHGHDEADSLKLSPQARKNIGLTTTEVKLQSYVRTISVPAIVTGRPGRSRIDVTAPLGGRVTRIYAMQGEAVVPGQPLFDLRLTHEELVRAQAEFLRSAEELDIVQREIQRLQSVTVRGAIPGKRLLERKYEQQKIEAGLNAQKQSLLLHGLTEQQVNDILLKRTLVQGLTVVAPEHPKNGNVTHQEHPFTVRTMHVKAGQYLDAGEPLSTLLDYRELYIEGRAFEHDADELQRAAREDWPLTAVREDNQNQAATIDGLKIVYVDNEVQPDSRALHFYVGLANEIVHTNETAGGHRFVTWRFKPGQRLQLQVPVEQWQDRIVLPVDAVAQDGPEAFVFQRNGDHFDRVSVHVEHQDQLWTVIANDGSIQPGDTVATSGAHQLQMALKNKAGSGPDPHAGHNH